MVVVAIVTEYDVDQALYMACWSSILWFIHSCSCSLQTAKMCVCRCRFQAPVVIESIAEAWVTKCGRVLIREF